jgi:hypothetical protein
MSYSTRSEAGALGLEHVSAILAAAWPGNAGSQIRQRRIGLLASLLMPVVAVAWVIEAL